MSAPLRRLAEKLQQARAALARLPCAFGIHAPTVTTWGQEYSASPVDPEDHEVMAPCERNETCPRCGKLLR